MDGHQAGTWRKRIEEQEGSGQSVVRYCAGQGVSRSSFYRWRKILAREDHPRARFLPVCVVQGKGEPFASAGVEIILRGGRRVEVKRGFDAETLLAAVAALEAVAC